MSCSKNERPVSEDVKPQIISSSPVSGVEGSRITITGANFNSTPKSNIIIINGVNIEPV